MSSDPKIEDSMTEVNLHTIWGGGLCSASNFLKKHISKAGPVSVVRQRSS